MKGKWSGNYYHFFRVPVVAIFVLYLYFFICKNCENRKRSAQRAESPKLRHTLGSHVVPFKRHVRRCNGCFSNPDDYFWTRQSALWESRFPNRADCFKTNEWSNITKCVQFVVYLQIPQYRRRLCGFAEMPLISVASAKFRVGSATFRLLKSGE